MNTYVLAIDPGITTGIAYVGKYGELLLGITEVNSKEVIQRVNRFKGDSVIVVVEDFVGAGPRTKEAIHVLKLIGGVCATCYLGNVRCVLQAPQKRIPLLDAAKQRTPKGYSPHALDAYAHALAFLEKESGHVQFIDK